MTYLAAVILFEAVKDLLAAHFAGLLVTLFILPFTRREELLLLDRRWMPTKSRVATGHSVDVAPSPEKMPNISYKLVSPNCLEKTTRPVRDLTNRSTERLP